MITPITALSAASQKSTTLRPEISYQRRGKILAAGLSDTSTVQFLIYADETSTSTEYPAQNSKGIGDSVIRRTVEKSCPLVTPTFVYGKVRYQVLSMTCGNTPVSHTL
jgi:hypothetical protein